MIKPPRLFKLVAVCCIWATVATTLLIRPNLSASQVPPQRFIRQIGPNLWEAGPSSIIVERLGAPSTSGRQQMQNWCWAASVQMTLNMAGIRVTQNQVVERIYGGDLDRGGTAQDIMNALSGWAPTVNGKMAELHPAPLTNDAEMLDDLSLGWPLIVGLKNPDGSGHAEVITAVTYAVRPDNTPIFRSVVLRDPWPLNPSREEISWAEFSARRNFVIRNHVTFPQGL
jgi:hypothetical protein